jgi:hypothetical protein
MKNIFLLIAVIFVFASCKKNHDVATTTTPPHAYDADAQKFFDSSAISDTSQRSAINDFVKELKDSSLWTKFMAIYPMLGGSANTNKWNLKDPRNSDDAYRLTFTGTPTFSGSGVLFSTPNDFADTHLYDSLLVYNDNSISYFSKTENTINGYDMGCSDNVSPYNEFGIYQSMDATNWFGYYEFGTVPLSTKGLFMISVTVNDIKRFDNGIMTMSKGSSPVNSFTGMPILIGTVSGATTVGQRECVLATIGKGLSDVEAQSFYNIANNFEVKLNR